MALSRLNLNFAIELLSDELGDVEAKTYTVGIEVFLRVDVSKKFEKLLLVVITYADTCVFDFYFYILIWESS